MNILFLIDRYPGFGGIEKVTHVLSEKFCTQLDYRVIVFSVSNQDNDSQLVQHPNWHYYTSKLKGEELHWYFLSIVDKHKIETIIYQDAYTEDEYLLEGIDRKKIRVIVCEHSVPNALEIGQEIATKEYPILSKVGLYRRLVYPYRFTKTSMRAKRHHRVMMELADDYVLLSPSFKKILLKSYNLCNEKVCAISNPIEAAQPYNCGSKENIVLFVGRLTKEKGTNKLMHIWSKIEQTVPDWKLVIVGDGSERSNIEGYITKHHLKNVILEGYQTDVAQYYKRAKILFMTSVFEGFGLVLAEAMSYGVIPFAFNSYASLTDIIDHERNGIIIPPFKEKLYAEEFVELISNGNRMQSLQNEAIKKAGVFSTDNIVQQWKKLLENK